MPASGEHSLSTLRAVSYMANFTAKKKKNVVNSCDFIYFQNYFIFKITKLFTI